MITLFLLTIYIELNMLKDIFDEFTELTKE